MWEVPKKIWAQLKFPLRSYSQNMFSSAECDQIPKMGQIICFYVNTHALKSEAGDFVILKHG